MYVPDVVEVDLAVGIVVLGLVSCACRFVSEGTGLKGRETRYSQRKERQETVRGERNNIKKRRGEKLGSQ